MPGVTSLNSSARVGSTGPGAYNDAVKTLTAAATIDSTYAGQTTVFNNATGFTVTLPAATGTGNVYTFVVKTTITSGSQVIQAASSSDSFVGYSVVVSDDAGGPAKGFIASAATDDTITFNGTTQGGYAGDTVIIKDIASGLFSVQVFGKATGTEATPFSAAV